MCFHYKTVGEKQLIEKRFKTTKKSEVVIEPITYVNAFESKQVPLILNNNEIHAGYWGLLPEWHNQLSFQKNTLNARIETIKETKSFKGYLSNRCLIPALSFFEWQWHNEKGTKKTKFEIKVAHQELFAFAGIYHFHEKQNILTFSMVTTQANALMERIHNTKKRMPVILKEVDEAKWLANETIENFAFPYETNLIAIPEQKNQLELF